MSIRNDNEYMDMYPNLFRNDLREKPHANYYGFAIGDGWLDIVHETIQYIDYVVNNQNISICQIKEKFGTLRIYISYGSDVDLSVVNKVREIISQAEQRALTTCEKCGAKIEQPIERIKTGSISCWCNPCQSNYNSSKN